MATATAVLDGAERRTGRLEERGAGLRQLDAARGPLQQLDAELLLEPGDRRAQRLLGDVQAARGACEVQLLGDRDEVAQLPELDIHSRGV